MNDAKRTSGMVTGILLPIGLICIFAFCSLALALMGGQAYKQINESIDDSYGSTVTANYLRTKLTQNNHAGAVSIREVDGMQVLIITSGGEEGAQYETRIYVYEGALWETFVAADQPMRFPSGIEIAQISECQFSISEDGLFEAVIISPRGVMTRTVFALAEGSAP